MKALFDTEARTGDVVVRTSVSYLADQSEPARGRWFWSYHIRIENEGTRTVQLLARHWIITDGRGARHSVEGEGVVGEQPVIEPGASFDYVSGCHLATPTGSMQGSYQMVDEDGGAFDVTIPKFALIAPAVS
ncbi:Co2+/Mg2+ efflux protein ApaG [Sphingomonas sp. 37zxx]|uniref:Co2+/Mg2+ efflux protein ApaG n=1 Tax=Sphingomonas sp. 37zxx TaxID=1550073 RepID=UPI00053BFA0A|nr:Co2+/Mg2+ efflux protein ApaG [Sphingomonas sp. 37zxx]